MESTKIRNREQKWRYANYIRINSCLFRAETMYMSCSSIWCSKALSPSLAPAMCECLNKRMNIVLGVTSAFELPSSWSKKRHSHPPDIFTLALELQLWIWVSKKTKCLLHPQSARSLCPRAYAGSLSTATHSTVPCTKWIYAVWMHRWDQFFFLKILWCI